MGEQANYVAKPLEDKIDEFIAVKIGEAWIGAIQGGFDTIRLFYWPVRDAVKDMKEMVNEDSLLRRSIARKVTRVGVPIAFAGLVYGITTGIIDLVSY